MGQGRRTYHHRSRIRQYRSFNCAVVPHQKGENNMKRTIAAGLSAALLCGMVVPAFAADTKIATNTTGTTQTQPTAPVKLTFDKLEETVRQNNVTIKANNNTVLSAEKTDVSDQYIESYFQLSEQI